jgi:predicted nucleotidyltransferase
MREDAMQRDDALRILREFKEKHGDEFYLTAIGLFGSVAREEANDLSDIDVVFKTTRPNLFRASRMRLELERLMGRHVDLVRLRDRMDPRLKARIEHDAHFA